jgi:hypothetical protein
MKSFSEIIDRWPSVAEFAADLGVPANHARTMKARNSIPAERWIAVTQAAQTRGIDGITLESLAMLAADRAPSNLTPTEGEAA